MPDSDEMLSDLYSEYSICNALVGFGVIFTLTIEQLVFIASSKPHTMLIESSKSGKECQDDSKTAKDCQDECYCSTETGDARVMPLNEIENKGENFSNSSQKALIKQHVHENEDHHDHDHAAIALNALSSASSLKDLITAYAMEISTAMHSVIIGFDLGVLTQDDISTIRILFAVLVFHQFAEGLGLGSVIKTSEKQLGSTKIITFMFIFSCTVSIGLILGLAIKPGDESDLQKGLEGSVTAIAAGSLLYIALVELVGTYFNLPELEKEGWKKIVMLVLFTFGAVVMGIIGIWA